MRRTLLIEEKKEKLLSQERGEKGYANTQRRKGNPRYSGVERKSEERQSRDEAKKRHPVVRRKEKGWDNQLIGGVTKKEKEVEGDTSTARVKNRDRG